MGYNKKIELTVDDMAMIEDALLRQKAELSNRKIDALTGDAPAPVDDLDGEMKDIADLLGRLHNQKVFYRPKSGVYVGG